MPARETGRVSSKRRCPTEANTKRTLRHAMAASCEAISRKLAYGLPGAVENSASLPGLSFHSSASSGGTPLRTMLGHSMA